MFEPSPSEETRGIIRERLHLIREALDLINQRMVSVSTANDFVSSSHGVTLMDAITLRLQTIGENIKKIERVAPEFLEQYPHINWNLIIRFRDLIAHHYEKTDYEVIFDICTQYLRPLQTTIEAMIQGIDTRHSTKKIV